MASFIKYEINKDFDIYDVKGSFSIAYHEAGVAACFDSFESAKLATTLDLNKIEELFKEKGLAALTVADLELLGNPE